MTRNSFDFIEAARRRFGRDLAIVGHHYQTDEVIRHTDMRGDSLELARNCASLDSRFIVFCGVRFMGESAALLAPEGSGVYVPDPSAECSMALMTSAPQLEKALSALESGGRRVVPLAYVNSTLAVKAVVGARGGSVCTSANAGTMLDWALAEGDAVLFLPDMNLGKNTADRISLPEAGRCTLDLAEDGTVRNPGAAEKAKLLLWPGYCSIHTFFTPAQVAARRAEFPGCKVAVHPECPPETVAAADAAGSTSFLIRCAAELPDGETLIIGTEVNLVRRLAAEHAGRIRILPLAESACSHMGQVTEERLADVLAALDPDTPEGGRAFRMRAPDELARPARAALERMLAVSA